MGIFDRLGNIAKAPLDFLDPARIQGAASSDEKFWEQSMISRTLYGSWNAHYLFYRRTESMLNQAELWLYYQADQIYPFH